MGLFKAFIAVIISIFLVNQLFTNKKIALNYPILKRTILKPKNKFYFVIFIMALFILF